MFFVPGPYGMVVDYMGPLRSRNSTVRSHPGHPEGLLVIPVAILGFYERFGPWSVMEGRRSCWILFRELAHHRNDVIYN